MKSEPTFSGWEQVQVAFEELRANAVEPFDADLIANVTDLLAVCRNTRVLVPTEVVKGYWNTVSVRWCNFEIEVFEDRLEVYRFYDQRTDIWYEEHRPGEIFTSRFLDELAGLAAS